MDVHMSLVKILVFIIGESGGRTENKKIFSRGRLTMATHGQGILCVILEAHPLTLRINERLLLGAPLSVRMF